MALIERINDTISLVCSLQHQIGELKASVYLLERRLEDVSRSSVSGGVTPKETDMSFLEAMSALERGHVVKRKSSQWYHKSCSVGHIIMWKDPNYANGSVIFTREDIAANDWAIVKPGTDTVEKRNWSEEKLKIIDEIRADVTQYLTSYHEDFENECTSVERMLEGIYEKAAQLKQLQD